MFKALIIDDEPLARSIILDYLTDIKNIEVIAECGDGFEGLKAINLYKPDLIFLDIQMPKITGFEMLELIEQPPAVIFTTAFDQFAIKAFEASAIDYLLKPFDKSRFEKAIEKWMMEANSDDDKRIDQLLTTNPDEQNRVVVKTSHGIKIIPIGEIIYLEAYDDYVKIYTPDGMFLKKRTMAYFENVLEKKDFIRVHRSFLLAINQITRIENTDKENHVAILKNGVRIPLSRLGYGKLKMALGI